jgi:hypothetical protein
MRYDTQLSYRRCASQDQEEQSGGRVRYLRYPTTSLVVLGVYTPVLASGAATALKKNENQERDQNGNRRS